MDRENVEYDGLIFSLKEYPAICDNIDKSGEQNAKWYKIQKETLHDDSKEKVVLIETESRMVVARVWEAGEMQSCCLVVIKLPLGKMTES